MIFAVEDTIQNLQKVIDGQETFKSLNAKRVANAGSGADPKYGDKCRRHLRSSFEKTYGLSAAGIAEGAAIGVASLGAGKDILEYDGPPTAGMFTAAVNVQKRSQEYLGFLQAVNAALYPAPKGQ